MRRVLIALLALAIGVAIVALVLAWRSVRVEYGDLHAERGIPWPVASYDVRFGPSAFMRPFGTPGIVRPWRTLTFAGVLHVREVPPREGAPLRTGTFEARGVALGDWHDEAEAIGSDHAARGARFEVPVRGLPGYTVAIESHEHWVRDPRPAVVSDHQGERATTLDAWAPDHRTFRITLRRDTTVLGSDQRVRLPAEYEEPAPR